MTLVRRSDIVSHEQPSVLPRASSNNAPMTNPFKYHSGSDAVVTYPKTALLPHATPQNSNLFHAQMCSKANAIQRKLCHKTIDLHLPKWFKSTISNYAMTISNCIHHMYDQLLLN
eukprot:773847_1